MLFGSSTAAEPSFGVDGTSTVGYVAPSSVDRLIFTFGDIDAASVPATFHVTRVGPDWAAEVACEVTRNGPAVGSTVRATSSHATPPTWSAGPSGLNSSRAVNRKCITRF